jgi:NTP pyrophosphatase (non-canonical NTP hydrolase)
MPDADPADSPLAAEGLTLRAFQQHIRDRYHDADAARGTEGTFMWFVEEVGELATALHKSQGAGGDTSGDADPAGEFADILAWLCTLANINDIDLESAVRAKYLGQDAPRGTK